MKLESTERAFVRYMSGAVVTAGVSLIVLLSRSMANLVLF
jgi:hypothetical protein